jgi:hypothetical protein
MKADFLLVNCLRSLSIFSNKPYLLNNPFIFR